MKVLISLIFCIHFLVGYSQKKYVQQYSFLANTQVPDVKKKFTFYFIIDSSVAYFVKEKYFYQFTFSEDSLAVSGFVSFDSKSGGMFYISDTLDEKKSEIQKIFIQKGNGLNNIRFFPHLGYGVKIKRKIINNTVGFIILYSFPNDSHKVILKEIEFKKGSIFPDNITFVFPFENKNCIKLFPTEISTPLGQAFISGTGL